MKTTEEKARAYDSIIEKANKMHSENCEACRACIEELIPELAESEDEKIRKWIINEIKIKHHNLDEENVDFVDKAIAWLEKQGQVKESTISQHENRTCEENGNSLTSEDAIEREVKEDAGGYPYIDATELYDYENDKPLAKAGDKVKVVFIKEK